jgi:formylglycine-generating enzyme required for sulfatase activity
MALIPSGSFTMGDNLEANPYAPPVTVSVGAFYIGKTEVTKALWDEVRSWAVANGYTDLKVGKSKGSTAVFPNHPVQGLSWFDVVRWCNARSEKEGLTPCYKVNGNVLKAGVSIPSVDWSANGYRLPTEAEWEKAARGGLSGKRFPWGDTISHSQANYRAKWSNPDAYDVSGGNINAEYHPSYAAGPYPFTSPVGVFPANGYGLHDMAGNLTEWCWDWYGAYAYGNGTTDPRGPSSGSVRVVRGGSWQDWAVECKCASRRGAFVSDESPGIRIVRTTVR